MCSPQSHTGTAQTKYNHQETNHQNTRAWITAQDIQGRGKQASYAQDCKRAKLHNTLQPDKWALEQGTPDTESTNKTTLPLHITSGVEGMINGSNKTQDATPAESPILRVPAGSHSLPKKDIRKWKLPPWSKEQNPSQLLEVCVCM